MQDLATRTQKFAYDIIVFYGNLPKDVVTQTIGKQFLRSGTSLGAHHREASRARSKSEFTSKINLGLQELEETRYWLELLLMAKIVTEKQLQPILQESTELVAILAAISKKLKPWV